MSQPPCSHIEAIIQQITQDLQAIDDQLHALEVEGLNLLNPWAYLVQQRKVVLGTRHLEFLLADGHIKEIDADFSPGGLEEVLAQLDLVLP